MSHIAVSAPREGERGADEHDGAEPGQRAHGGDVAGRARHEIAGAVPVVERGRQGEEPRVEVRADVVLHPLPGAQHGEARPEARHAVRRGQGQDQEHEGRDPGGGAVPLEGVHRALHRPRDAQRERGGEQEAGDAPEIAEPVASQIAAGDV